MPKKIENFKTLILIMYSLSLNQKSLMLDAFYVFVFDSLKSFESLAACVQFRSLNVNASENLVFNN